MAHAQRVRVRPTAREWRARYSRHLVRPAKPLALLETTSPVSLRGTTSYPSLSGQLRLPLPGPKALAAAWRRAGQVGFPGEATVEAEEAAAATRVSSMSKGK